jgi:hypothetical protein
MATTTVPLWGRWEQVLEANSSIIGDAAAQALDLSVELIAPSGTMARIDGFWDGGSIWRFRFMPTEEGVWKYRTTSKPSLSGLDGIEGSFTCTPAEAKTPFTTHGAIRISDDHHYLQHADGTPFFWLGDTVWSGPALCPTMDEWEFYLQTRADQRYTVAQFNNVCPWRAAAADAEGRTAFTGRENIQIDPAYFQRLDRYFDAVNDHGLLASPILIWSLTPKDPGHYLSEEDCLQLARYQVARYQAHHVLWILAGDNPYNENTTDKWKHVGRVLFGTGGNPFQAPVTSHPTGQNWPWESWRDESWLTVLGYQSGHGDGENSNRWLHSGPPHQNWRAEPARPIINLEPPYEGHNGYQSKQPHSAFSVRRAVYGSLLCTRTAGVTYGGQGIWSWQKTTGEEPADHPGSGIAALWREALNLPGGREMRFVVNLFESLPWWSLRPAEELLLSQPGETNPAAFISVSRSDDGKSVVAYLPFGGEIALRPEALPSPGKSEWFNPRDGQRVPTVPQSPGIFRAPDSQDWVLVLS